MYKQIPWALEKEVTTNPISNRKRKYRTANEIAIELNMCYTTVRNELKLLAEEGMIDTVQKTKHNKGYYLTPSKMKLLRENLNKKSRKLQQTKKWKFEFSLKSFTFLLEIRKK